MNVLAVDGWCARVDGDRVGVVRELLGDRARVLWSRDDAGDAAETWEALASLRPLTATLYEPDARFVFARVTL